MTATARVDLDAVVRDAFARVLDRDPAGLTAATTLADLGADSLVRVCVADVVEGELVTAGRRTTDGAVFRFDDGDLDALPDLAAFADYLRARLGD